MRAGLLILVLIGALLLSFSALDFATTQAQVGGVCGEFVQQALTAIGDNCSSLNRNSACYGFNRVEALFTGSRPGNFFSQPADQAALIDLQSLTTVPLDVVSNQWGIAILNIQADLPDALPGQAVTFLLFGDVAMENAVDPSVAQVEARMVLDVTTTAASDLRTRPTQLANSSASIPSGTLLTADQRSSDGQWVRVVYDAFVGWLPFESITSAESLEALPLQDEVPFTPMQSVRLRTGLVGVDCSEAPPSVAIVQGPQQMTVNLTVNGAELNIGSTIALWTPTPDKMMLAVIDGGVYLADGTYIPAGYISEVQLDESGNVTGEWTAPRPMTPEEWAQFEGLEGVPASVLNYPIEIPSEIIASLFPTATPVPAPQVNNPRPNPPQVIQFDCAGLRPTSPLDGLPFGRTTFYWDGVSGGSVSSYQVNVYRDGGLAASFSTNGAQTNVTGDLSSLPLGGAYSWEVRAIVNGVAVCTQNANVSLARSFPPEVPPPASPQVPVVTPEITPEVTPEIEPPLCIIDEFCDVENGENSETCPSDCFNPCETCVADVSNRGVDAVISVPDCPDYCFNINRGID